MVDLTMSEQPFHQYYLATPEQLVQQAPTNPMPEEGTLPNQFIEPEFSIEEARTELKLSNSSMLEYMPIAHNVIWTFTHNNFGLIPTHADVTRKIVAEIREVIGNLIV